MVIGGIYKDKGATGDAIEYLVHLAPNSLFCIFDGITDIQEITELGINENNFDLVQGYALSFKKLNNTWQIRDSAKKHEPDYIIQSGRYEDGFIESLKPYLKQFHK